VTATAPVRLQIDLGVLTIVEVAPTEEGPKAERMAPRRLVLQLSSGPPIPTGRDLGPGEDFEGVGRCIEESLDVDLEACAGLEVAAQRSSFERSGLPVATPEDGSGFIRDDIPAGDREQEIELPNAEQMGAGHEIDV
jgi:hypothetical protein